MKTQLPKSIILFIVLLFGTIPHLNAQEHPNDELTKMYDAQKDLTAAFNTMLKTETLNNWKDNKPCKANDLINSINKSQLELSINELNAVTRNLFSRIQAVAISETIDKGSFESLTDKALQALSNDANFEAFVKAYTGKGVNDIKGKTEFRGEILSKDIDVLRDYYLTLKELTTNYKSNNEYNINDRCRYNSTNTITIKTISYPNATWDLKTTVIVDCVCDNDALATEVKNGSYEYTASVSGTLTGSTITFMNPKNSRLSVLSLKCCGDKEDKEEPSNIDPVAALNAIEGINDLMPDQTIGFGIGAGFAQDFEETTFCVFGEYLYQLNSSDDQGWYIGAEASYQHTSFGDFSSSVIKGGPKLQYNFAATPSQETQFVVGIMANYATGSNDNNGFKDDFTGLIGCAYSGVNIRICEDWSVGGQFPIFIYESFTFKPESGGEFEVDGTSLFINKDNPFKIVVRHSF
ncbi:hypothetical protein [Psychroserpens sp. SPM9]|uniref:hypothetical protein n=1 Tax=Psychroserpens sp. SPM9 TaxID=2975598 RepID=UPI0021A27CA1|nr:hypothetical protein [Psychroserpens sp. SPM9]MDG5491045.1 hypothetical protein [Psychroserpens sp. SPM9]